MKIHRITTHNINSLAGFNSVDFEKHPLHNCGLFAIVGPTGSGKSSLLDAITLALYGITPRLGNITKGQILEKHSIVTSGTREAMAMVEWSAGKNNYRSRWMAELNTNRAGEDVCQVSMTLEMERKQGNSNTWEQISTTPKDAAIKTEEITGFSADQFNQAILLSQGQFDQFLRMKSTDRYALLEILTNSGLFRKLGQAAYKLHQQCKEQLSRKKEIMDGIHRMSDEEWDALINEIENLKTTITQAESQRAELEKQKSQKEKLKSVQNHIAKLQQEKSNLETGLAARQDDRKRVERYDAALPLQPDYLELDTLKSRHNHLAAEFREKHAERKAAADAKNTCMLELSAASGKSSSESSFEQDLQSFKDRIQLLDKNLHEKLSQRQNINLTLKSTLQVLNPEIQSRLAAHEWLQTEKVERLQREATLEIRNYRATTGEGELETISTAVEDEMKLTSLQLENHKRVKDHKTIQSGKADRIRDLDHQILKLKDQQQHLDETKTRMEDQLNQLRKDHEHFLAWHNIKTIRENLQEGEACPCCGSTTHPSAGQPVGAPTDFSRDIETCSNQLNEVQEQRVSCGGKLTSALESKQQLTQEINDIDKLLQELGAHHQTDDEGTLQKKYTRLEEKMKAVKRLLIIGQSGHVLTGYLNSLQELKDLENQIAIAQMDRGHAWNGTNVEEFSAKLNETFRAQSTVISNLERKLNELNNELDRLHSETTSRESEFVLRLKSAGFASLLELQTALADAHAIQKIRSEISTLENEIRTKAALLENSRTELNMLVQGDDHSITLETITQQWDELNLTIRRWSEEKGRKEQQKETQESNRSRLLALQAEWSALENHFQIVARVNACIGDATGNSFNNHVQRLTLKKLIHQANERLHRMMDRYRLKAGEGEHVDTIWVIDRHMGEDYRTVETVSGGEKFVISLALALGLSDMASDRAEIENMFIDEGFGSLSPEALDGAISLLESLQATNNKTIGIISHVESLKEQIQTKIQITPTGRGHSSLQVVGPGY